MHSQLSVPPVGTLLRDWRQRRRWSQLDLALHADVSARHLSFVETGRSVPSRDMLLRLADRLDVPLRERNAMLVSAGYAPMYAERPLEDASMAPARRALESVLTGHEPYPAFVVDRHWNVLLANQAATAFLSESDPSLMQPRVNVLRLTLHPKGLAPRIVNYGQVREHALARLHQQVETSRDPVLQALLDELQALPPPEPAVADAAAKARPHEEDLGGVAVPLMLRSPAGVLSFISTITVFGNPVNITLAELALETLFPADPATAQALQALHEQRKSA